MKYMEWKDLEPGDVIRFSDEFLECYKDNPTFYNKYKDIDLIISKIGFTTQYIEICDQFNDGFWDISYDGASIYSDCKILPFKIIKLKETE